MIKLNISQPRTWGNYLVRSYVSVGAAGKQNGPRGTSGGKVHLLHVTEIIDVIDKEAEKALNHNTLGKQWLREQAKGETIGRTRRDVFFSIRGGCGSNGQHCGVVDPRLDLTHVTCSKCLKSIDSYIEEFTAQQLGAAS